MTASLLSTGLPPTPVTTTVPEVIDEPDRLVDVGAYRLFLTGILTVDFGESAWEGWHPVDSRTVALVSAGTRHVDIGQHRYVGGAQTWIADLAGGRMELFAHDQALISMNPSGTRLLLFGLAGNVPVWNVVDRTGQVLSSLDGPYSVTFLDDESVVLVEAGRIGIWGVSDGSVSWSNLPSPFDSVRITVAGRNVVVTGSGVAAVIDPETGNQIGDAWPAGPAGGLVASPDGLRFAVAVDSGDEPNGRVEIRSAESGALIAVDPGRAFTTIEGALWPTDNVIVLMRASTGTGVEPVPEVHTLADFAAIAVETESLVTDQLAVAGRNGLVLAMSLQGRIVLLTASESVR
jgi:hypothetical protein